jgi:hypothetical protein
MRERIVVTLLLALVASLVGLSRFAAAGKTMGGGDGQSELSGYANTGSARVRSEAGVVRLGSGNWQTLTNRGRYGVLVVGAANANFAGAQPGRALIYGCGINIPNATWSGSCGVSWREAVANNWLLKDANGNYVPYGDGSSYLADLGNSSYQRRFVSEMDSDIRVHRGIDGVFIDNVVGSLITRSFKYQDSASYRLAMLAFVKVVGQALKRKGWYVAVNASILDAGAQSFTGKSYDGTQYIWWAKQIAPYVSGISMERWQQNWDSRGSVRTSGTAGTQAWDGWERLPSVVASLGKDFYALEKGALNDAGRAAYLRASFLLAWKRGRAAFFYTEDSAGRGDPWGLVAKPDIGRPAGSRRPIGVGFRRTFTNGTVVVNPSPSQSQTFAFQRKYLMPDGTETSSVTLPPASGLVLRRASLG